MSEKGIKREVDKPTFKSLDKVAYSQYNYTRDAIEALTHTIAYVAHFERWTY